MGNQFNRGDVVRLKSGGPSMTVAGTEVTDQGKLFVNTEWFTTEDELRSGCFEDCTVTRLDLDD